MEEAGGDSNTFTVNGFTAVLKALETMPQLTVLDMQLPLVMEFEVDAKGTHLLLNLGGDHKGAQFVA
jgi:hypothetical protein